MSRFNPEDTEICSRCGGDGYDYFDGEHEPCYHCSTSGYIDSDTAYRDRVEALIYDIAYHNINDLRDSINSDPEGEGWDFCAAESMMNPHDYFSMKVSEEAYFVGQEIEKMSSEDIDFLLAWKEYPWEQIKSDSQIENSECTDEFYEPTSVYIPDEAKTEVDVQDPDYLPF